MTTNRSFFGSLFDLSFTTYVTLKWVKFLYVLAIIVLGLIMLVMVVVGLTASESVAGTVGYLVAVPIVALVYLILVRVWFEIVVVLFRIGETAVEIRDLLATR